MNTFRPDQMREIYDYQYNDMTQTHAPVGQHHFSVLTPGHEFYQDVRDQIMRQVGVAMKRDLAPDQSSVCLVMPTWLPNANWLGAFSCVPDEDHDVFSEYIDLMDNPQEVTQINLIKINLGRLADVDEDEKLTDIIEHETWHMIDQMGNHSNIRNMRPLGVDQQRAQSAGEMAFQREVGYNPLTGETLRTPTAAIVWRSMTAQLDQWRAYANHGSEWFVHEQMCRTRGMTPGTLEGYCTTHGLLQSILNLIRHHENTGSPRSQLRGVWQKQVWPQITHSRPKIRQILQDQDLAWLLR